MAARLKIFTIMTPAGMKACNDRRAWDPILRKHQDYVTSIQNVVGATYSVYTCQEGTDECKAYAPHIDESMPVPLTIIIVASGIHRNDVHLFKSIQLDLSSTVCGWHDELATARVFINIVDDRRGEVGEAD